jgi:hypothetical protein
LVVERVVVVEIGPVGLSLADTVTVLDDVQVRLPHSSSAICVGSRTTDRSAPMVIEPLEAHPNSSEMTRPFAPVEYVKISRHGWPGDPSSFDDTNRFVSAQTCRPPLVEQLDAKLEKFDPFGDVSAATGPTASRRLNGTARNASANRRMGDPLSSRRIRWAGTRLATDPWTRTIGLGRLASIAPSGPNEGT